VGARFQRRFQLYLQDVAEITAQLSAAEAQLEAYYNVLSTLQKINLLDYLWLRALSAPPPRTRAKCEPSPFLVGFILGPLPETKLATGGADLPRESTCFLGAPYKPCAAARD
jgi:hypothetical protein